jgi:DNA-binding NarL/FixJ family response regulator
VDAQGKHLSTAASTKARILVVDDHPMVRDGLIQLISHQTDLVCCGEADTVQSAQAAVQRKLPDLVILDLRLKGGDGLDLIKTLRSQYPKLKILILSQYEAPMYAERALRAGAIGYLVKEQAAEEVLKAIRTVLSGEVYLARGMASVLLQSMVGLRNQGGRSGVEMLTDRELHVLNLLGGGLSTRQIANELKLSFKTVETHRENIKRKLGLRNAAALVHYATQWGRGQAPAANTTTPALLHKQPGRTD